MDQDRIEKAVQYISDTLLGYAHELDQEESGKGFWRRFVAYLTAMSDSGDLSPEDVDALDDLYKDVQYRLRKAVLADKSTLDSHMSYGPNWGLAQNEYQIIQWEIRGKFQALFESFGQK